MSVKGKAREGGNYSKETGFGEYKVICVNPDREALEKLLGITIDKDIEYVSTDDNGVKKVNITFWLRSVKDENKIKSVKFFLKDSPRQNKDKTKNQYINDVGTTSWADEPNNLPEWFSKRNYRIAHEGEEELYNFITTWLQKLDLKDAESALSFDWDKLMAGNVRDIAVQINGEYDGTIIALSTVRVVEKDGETKEYEQIYNRKFLPGYEMKKIRIKKDNSAFITQAKALEKTDKKKLNRLQKFILDVTDPTHGIKDYYTLDELENYDPSKNIVSSDKPLVEEDDASY